MRRYLLLSIIITLAGLIPATADDRLQNDSGDSERTITGLADAKTEAEISQRGVQIDELRQEIWSLLNELKALEEKMHASIESKNMPFLSTLDESIKNIETAREEALAWLSETGRHDLIVGPIEKVGWIYVVDIVAKKNPNELRNQLLIRSLDGFYTTVR